MRLADRIERNKEKKIVAQTAKNQKKQDEQDQPKKLHGYGANIVQLSPELAAVIGTDKETRPQVNSKIWKYIKENNLQNPSDGRQIFADDKLKAIFKVDKVNMFGMQKLLSKHIYPIEKTE